MPGSTRSAPPGVDCSIQQTLDVIGDRWTLLILRDVFRGIRRFTPLADDLGVARNLLTERLGRLVECGILEKVPYQRRPLRHEYHLTAKGRDLSASLVALMQWGDRWAAPSGPPTLLVHRRCGSTLQQQLVCPSCVAPVEPTEIRSRPGPGRSTESFTR